jgi:alkyldihydroxyacetonephosphate synthase
MNDDKYRHKWWGWGADGSEYDMDSRPSLWRWIREIGELGDDPELQPRVERSEIRLPPPRHTDVLASALRLVVGDGNVGDDDDDRLLHCYGRSYRDVARLRAGLVDRAPDIVVYPGGQDDVVRIVALAAAHGAALIPFGGGTNVAGCVETPENDPRPSIALDMRRMSRLLAVDAGSMTAELQAGMFGPQIEAALAPHGVSLGHHPDSFMYSTLGGWLATRSAGTHSNVYGKIEDMVVGMTVVTPTGVIETKPLPAASTGPDLKRLLVGSEGTFGVITGATMRVHRIPEYEDYRMLLFPTYRDGFNALHQAVREGYMPSVARLSDELETEMMFAAKRPSTGIESLIQGPAKRLLRARGYGRPAALVVAFEGPRSLTRELRRRAMAIFKKHRAFDLGTGPGEAWKESRYDVPYLRDFMMEYGAIADSFETATVWSNLMPLYAAGREKLRRVIREVTGFEGYIGSHISHLYETGACLYYTICTRCREGSTPEEAIEQYAEIKRVATEAFVGGGGALSHHHAVGYEHRPWIERELSQPGMASLRQLKSAIDPDGIMNPGSLFSTK